MKISPLRRLYKLLHSYRKEINQIYVYAMLIGIVNLTLPLGIQAIINFLQTGEITSTWFLLVGFVLVGFALMGWLQVIQLRIVENIQEDLFARSAFEFAYRLPKVSFLELDKIHAPELVNRFFDTLTIQKGLPKILIDFSLAVFQIVIGLILLAIYSPFFILLGILLAFILYIIFRLTGQQGLSTSLKESKYKYQIAHWLEEIARINSSFKLFEKTDFHLDKTDYITKNYLSSRKKHFKVLVQQFWMFIGFKVIVAAGLLLLGGFLVFKGQMDIGQFVASEIMIILIINSIEKVMRTTDTIYDVLTAIHKIGYVTDLELDKKGGKSILNEEKGISIRANEISFGFPDEKTRVINNLSFEVEANENVVLAGPSGSGKSLLLRILSGVYEVQEGYLYINNIPYDNYRKQNLFGAIGVSFASNQIFEGSFRENILFGRSATDEELTEVIETLKLSEYIMHQPRGLDGFVDSGGRRLPAGIIQKILLARMIIGKPKLLLMEDPLLNISDEEKKRIIDYLTEKERTWTIIVISDFYYWGEKSDRTITLNSK